MVDGSVYGWIANRSLGWVGVGLGVGDGRKAEVNRNVITFPNVKTHASPFTLSPNPTSILDLSRFRPLLASNWIIDFYLHIDS